MEGYVCPNCSTMVQTPVFIDGREITCSCCGTVLKEAERIGETPAHQEIERLTGQRLPTGAELAKELGG